MTVVRAEPATAAAFELGEGALWDRRGRVLSGVLRADRIVDIEAVELGQTAGAVALAEDGGLLIAAARGLAASWAVSTMAPFWHHDREAPA